MPFFTKPTRPRQNRAPVAPTERLESRLFLSGSRPFSGIPAAIPGIIQAENFDNGGEAVAFHDTEAANLGGAYRATAVDLEPTGDTGGGFNVGWTHAGEWLNYSVNVAATGNYDLAIRVADAVQGGSFHVEVDGVNVSGSLAVPNTGNWQSYTTLAKTGIPLTAGNHVVKLAMDTNGTYGFVGNFNWMSFTASPVIPPTSGPFGGTPAAVSGTIEAENFDLGADGVAYHDTTPINEGGSSYRQSGVDLEASADAGGGYNVGWTHAGEWLTYTIKVPVAGKYDLAARVASAGVGGTFHVEFGGVDKTGPLTVPNTGAWQTFATVVKNGIDLPAGTYVMKVAIDGNGVYGFAGNYNWFKLTPAEPARNLLFFGNSFTAYNNLPALVSTIAALDGHAKPNVFAQATFGWTLTDQLNKLATDGSGNIIRSLPAGAAWDDVIMQDLSTRPTSVRTPPINGDAAAFRADAAALFKQVHDQSPGVHDVLLETWARGADSPFYPGSYSGSATMQSELLTNYTLAAGDANQAFGAGTAIVAPAGEAWKARGWARELYDGSDEYHPSPKGSLLAALVVYRAAYHDDTADIPAANATALLASLNLTAADWTQLTSTADSV